MLSLFFADALASTPGLPPVGSEVARHWDSLYNFLVALSEREKNNPQYEFLRSTSKNNGYFLAVVGAYTAILEMSAEEMERWASYARGEGILERCKEVFDFHSAKQQQARGKK